jgi:hypothetical protein
MAISLAVRRAGWRLRWDPDVRVDHFPAPRFDADARGGGSLTALANEQHNDLYVVLRHGPPSIKPAALLYRLLVGTPHAPGVLRAPLELLRAADPQDRRNLLRLVAAVLRARLQALRTLSRSA